MLEHEEAHRESCRIAYDWVSADVKVKSEKYAISGGLSEVEAKKKVEELNKIGGPLYNLWISGQQVEIKLAWVAAEVIDNQRAHWIETTNPAGLNVLTLKLEIDSSATRIGWEDAMKLRWPKLQKQIKP